MRKLLIVPAILAMTYMSGSAFAIQRGASNTGSPTTALRSPVITLGSPVVGANGALNAQVSIGNAFGSGSQSQTTQQVTQGSVGISGGNSASMSR